MGGGSGICKRFPQERKCTNVDKKGTVAIEKRGGGAVNCSTIPITAIAIALLVDWQQQLPSARKFNVHILHSYIHACNLSSPA
jgi:hypothetical protein